jgi:hypothetical protein
MGGHAYLVLLHNCFEGWKFLIYLDHVGGIVDSVERRGAGVKEHGNME